MEEVLRSLLAYVIIAVILSLISFGLAVYKRKDKIKAGGLAIIGFLALFYGALSFSEAVTLSPSHFVYTRLWSRETRIPLDKVSKVPVRNENRDRDVTTIWQVRYKDDRIEEFSGDLLRRQSVRIINYLRTHDIEVNDSR